MNKPSLKDKLRTQQITTPVSELSVSQPCPVVQEPTPITLAAPLIKKPSLKDKLRSPVMGAVVGREQPSLVGEMKAETGLDRAQDLPPVSPVPAVVITAPSKPSLSDKLRQQVKDKAAAPSERAVSPAPVSSPSLSPSEDTGVSYSGSSLSLKDKIHEMKQSDVVIDKSFEPSLLSPESDVIHLLDRYGRPITLNDKQASAVDMALSGQSFVLTGEAGTGKSTTIEAVLVALLKHHREKIKDVSYRMNDRSGGRIMGPSCCVCAYTRKAMGNVVRILSHNFELHAEIEGSLQTIHNLLEYTPVIQWSEKQEREVQIFKPAKGEWDKLGVTHLMVEEASMLGLDLAAEVFAALQAGVQIIYIGDINQLPPVFGKSIMSYALVKLPIVHLDIVYRQALDNPIIANAHNVLHGKDIEEARPAVKWIKGKNKVVQPQETMARAMGKFFEQGLENKDRIERWREAIDIYHQLTLEEKAKVDKPKSLAEIEALESAHISYDPDQDIVLIPFNKGAMGTKNINYRIAQTLGERRGAEVFEIIAGFEKHYLAVGDHVLCNKMEGKITKISSNMQYMGKKPMKPSTDLSRFGFYTGKTADAAAAVMNGDDDFDMSDVEIDNLQADIEEEAERRQQSSHIITCELETGQIVSLTSAGDFNGQIFQLGYALSVHKAQGSEWRRVFILFHKAHSTMLSRELLYTAMTRAREELVIVARPELIKKAIGSPRIKGNSLAEKIEYFNSGYLDEDIEVTV